MSEYVTFLLQTAQSDIQGSCSVYPTVTQNN